MAALAGNDGAQFFGIVSHIGPGFYILLAYCFVGGLTHYFFNCAVTEYYRIHPYQKVDYIWTKMFGCLLNDVNDDEEAPMAANKK